LKNRTVRPTKIATTGLQKVTSYVRHTTIVADNLWYLSK